VAPTSSSFTSSSNVVHQRRTQQLKTRKQLPTFHRTASAPVSSAAKDTPAHSRKSSLLRYDISTPEINDSSFQNVTAPEGEVAKGKPENVRSASTPNIGTLFMKNSTGINSMLSRNKDTMLNKKRKRKDSSLELVPESDQIFAGLTFFYIPPDDKAPVRRFRITKARSFGVMWTKEVGPVSFLPSPS
jgi:DNA polymerase IV